MIMIIRASSVRWFYKNKYGLIKISYRVYVITKSMIKAVLYSNLYVPASSESSHGVDDNFLYAKSQIDRSLYAADGSYNMSNYSN